MNTLRTWLNSEYEPGVYRLDTKTTVTELSRLVANHSFHFFYIDGREVLSKETFLKSAAEAMNFPTYVGNNWDAFEEALTDLEWCPGDGYMLLYDHFELFSQHDLSQWKIAFEILQSAVASWKEAGTPMYVLLRGNNTIAARLPVLQLG